MDIIFGIAGFIVSFIEATGYVGIAFLMALEGSFIPIPSEIILPFAGYLVSQGKLSLVHVALVGAVGNIIGTIFTYFIARYIGLPFFYRWGKYVMITRRDIELATRLFHRWGVAIIFVSRLLPGVRGFVPIPAGIAKMRLIPFVIYVFTGSFLYSLALTYIGVLLGENWVHLEVYFRQYNWLLVALGVLGLSWWVWRYVKHTRNESQ